MNVPGWPLLAATALLLVQEPACNSSAPNSHAVTRTLPNGATLLVRRVEPNNLGQGCEVLVRDPNSKPIFEERGFNTRIDAATGHDIDNDRQADAVVGVDTIGGKTGNWEYAIISFAPTPRMLLKLP